MKSSQMNFEQFAKRHTEIMEQALSDSKNKFQATDEEIFKIYVGLYVLQEHIAKAEKLYRHKRSEGTK